MNLYFGLIACEMLYRNERETASLIIKNRMTLTECAASCILSGEPDAHAFGCERCKCERFRCRPIQQLLTLGHPVSGFETALKFWVNVEFIGQIDKLDEQFRETLRCHAS